MTERLEIRKGGKLYQNYWGEDAQSFFDEDITDRAVSLLFESCTIQQGVTLRDILLLLNTQIEIFQLVLQNWCKEFVAEGIKKHPHQIESRIEYLELYWDFRKDFPEDSSEEASKDPGLFGYRFPALHGVGRLLEEDYYEKEHLLGKAGERIHFSVSVTPLEKLMHLPVQLRPTLTIYNETNWEEQSQLFDACEYTLGHILYGILWELSFHGSPDSRKEFADELTVLMKTKKTSKDHNLQIPN